jgi:hypothetical protein
MWAVGSEDDYLGLHDDGPICIEDDEAPLLPHGAGAGAAGASGAAGGDVSLGTRTFFIAFEQRVQ